MAKQEARAAAQEKAEAEEARRVAFAREQDLLNLWDFAESGFSSAGQSDMPLGFVANDGLILDFTSSGFAASGGSDVSGNEGGSEVVSGPSFGSVFFDGSSVPYVDQRNG